MSSLDIAASRYTRREGAGYLTMHAHKAHKAHSHPATTRTRYSPMDDREDMAKSGPDSYNPTDAVVNASRSRAGSVRARASGRDQGPVEARAASRKVLGIPAVGVYMNPRVRGILTEPSGSKRAAVRCEATSFWWDRVNVECCAGGQDAPAPNAGILTSSVDCARTHLRTAYRAATPWIDHGCLPRTGGRSSTCSYGAAAAVQVPPNRRRRVQYSL